MNNVTTTRTGLVQTFVRFSEIKEGEWFYYPPTDIMGVKIGGHGFYPRLGIRGNGIASTLVNRLRTVDIYGSLG